MLFVSRGVYFSFSTPSFITSHNFDCFVGKKNVMNIFQLKFENTGINSKDCREAWLDLMQMSLNTSKFRKPFSESENSSEFSLSGRASIVHLKLFNFSLEMLISFR